MISKSKVHPIPLGCVKIGAKPGANIHLSGLRRERIQSFFQVTVQWFIQVITFPRQLA